MRLASRRIALRPHLKGDGDFRQELISELPAHDNDSNIWDRNIVERKSDGSSVGIIDYNVSDPDEGWATFGTIVMSDGQRGWGYGSEAVHLIEERLRKRKGVRRFRARVDKRLGLALYFWLRRGYRPAASDEAFWLDQNSDDIISMIRKPEE